MSEEAHTPTCDLCRDAGGPVRTVSVSVAWATALAGVPNSRTWEINACFLCRQALHHMDERALCQTLAVRPAGEETP